MKNIIRLTLLSSLSLSLLWSSFAIAQDSVLPPPEHDMQKHGQSSAVDTMEEGESPSNLNEALAPPKNDEGVDVRTYLREEDQAKITEYSMHGRVFSIKVQPAGGLPAYYLEDSDGDGNLNRRLPGGYKPINPPMWIIKRF